MRCIILWTLILTLCGFSVACEKEAPSGPGALEPIQPRDRVHDKNALAQVRLPSWPPLGSAGVDLTKLPRSYRRGMTLLDADPDNLALAEAAQNHAKDLIGIPHERPLGLVLQGRLQLVLGRKPDGQILDGNLTMAAQHFATALEANPKCYEAIFYQADLVLKAKHMAKYDALVKRAHALRPDSPETRFLALRQKSRLISWTDWLQEANTLIADAHHPDLLRQTYSLVAQSYRVRDNSAKALAIHQAMVDRLPDDPAAITLFIKCWLEEGLPDKALELAKQLERLRPGDTLHAHWHCLRVLVADSVALRSAFRRSDHRGSPGTERGTASRQAGRPGSLACRERHPIQVARTPAVPPPSHRHRSAGRHQKHRSSSPRCTSVPTSMQRSVSVGMQRNTRTDHSPAQSQDLMQHGQSIAGPQSESGKNRSLVP